MWKSGKTLGGGNLHIEYGEKTGSGTNSSGLATWNITFDKPFSSAPIIYTRGKEASGSYYSNFGCYVSSSGTDVTANGFTLKGRQNYTGATRSFTIEWLAIENNI